MEAEGDMGHVLGSAGGDVTGMPNIVGASRRESSITKDRAGYRRYSGRVLRSHANPIKPPPPEPDPDWLTELETATHRITTQYKQFCVGTLPCHLFSIEIRDVLPDNPLAGWHSEELIRNTLRHKSELSFSDSEDTGHVALRLPLFKWIFGDILHLKEVGSPSTGRYNEATARTPFDSLLKVMSIPQAVGSVQTSAVAEVKVAISRPRDEDGPMHLLDNNGIFSDFFEVAQSDALMLLHPSREVQILYRLAKSKQVPPAPKETSWKSVFNSEDPLSFILNVTEYNLEDLEGCIAQVEFVMVAMQRLLQSFGLTDVVVFGSVVDPTAVRIFGCFGGDKSDTLYVHLCETLSISHAPHFWRYVFFLSNLERWGRVEFHQMLRGILNTPHSFSPKAWRCDTWLFQRKNARLAALERTREESMEPTDDEGHDGYHEKSHKPGPGGGGPGPSNPSANKRKRNPHSGGKANPPKKAKGCSMPLNKLDGNVSARARSRYVCPVEKTIRNSTTAAQTAGWPRVLKTSLRDHRSAAHIHLSAEEVLRRADMDSSDESDELDDDAEKLKDKASLLDRIMRWKGDVSPTVV
ncbi:hypothetical protein DACRYDRAFT_111552 [Dacryopinax primogenitus]|uniref:Uncharacterized protein n=1 Tax=Dacryopinax primogenitus (strain DJM 731) TaxID=1858805 RepID=M5FVW6_DACPD|nr:uncharacterized protein DACRYDRAFT_111552 [Dacryopinax primogenitus]EJT97506.1 hypothetical protein DACRYDRAFT_111552 [Dacryopinax primogenitus]